MTEYRKSIRESVFLPVSVSAKLNGDGQIAGTIAGRILNISNQGACLLMTKMEVDQFHFYHSLQNDDSGALKLYIQNGNSEALIVAARPIWFDTIQLDDAKIFKIGINFSSSLDNGDFKRISTA